MIGSGTRGPIAQGLERSADNGEVSRSSRLRPTMCSKSLNLAMGKKQRSGNWGYSSVGRASVLQAEGQRFESAYLHQFNSFFSLVFSQLKNGIKNCV